MIIYLKGASFADSNIGTLSTWTISRVLGDGATYNGVAYVDKNTALNATVTIDDGYELGSAGVTVTMGGNPVTSGVTTSGNTITINITSVTGNVVIKVPTINTSTGEEDNGNEVPDGATLVTSGSLAGAYLYENYKFIGTSIGSYTGIEADTSSTYFVYDKIPVIAGRNITITKGRAFYYSNSSGTLLSTNQGNLTSGATNYTVTVPTGAAYISVAFKYADIQPSAVTMTMSAALSVESETLISTLTTNYADEKGYDASSATVMVEAAGYFGYGDIPVSGGRYYKIPYARYTYILDTNKNSITSLNLNKDVADWTYQMPNNAAYINTTFKKADGVTAETAKLILMKED